MDSKLYENLCEKLLLKLKAGNCDCNCHVFQKINLLSVDVYIVSV